MGTIEIITGPMYSGKSSELLRRVRHAIIAKQQVQIFKPQLDTRTNKELKTHDGQKIHCIEIKESTDLLNYRDSTDIYALEEVQFFDDAIVDICEYLRNIGKRVIISGLDMDYAGEPFMHMAELMAVADKVKKLSGICVQCGEPGTMSARLSPSTERIVVGATETYECRCRKHWKEAIIWKSS